MTLYRLVSLGFVPLVLAALGCDVAPSEATAETTTETQALRATRVTSGDGLETEGGSGSATVIAKEADSGPTSVSDFKKKFKEGCEAGHGSYVESANNNTFGCNTSGGGTVTCNDADNVKDIKCTYSGLVRPPQTLLDSVAGDHPSLSAQ